MRAPGASILLSSASHIPATVVGIIEALEKPTQLYSVCRVIAYGIIIVRQILFLFALTITQILSTPERITTRARGGLGSCALDPSLVRPRSGTRESKRA